MKLKQNIGKKVRKGAPSKAAPFISYKKSKFNYFLFIEKRKDWRFLK